MYKLKCNIVLHFYLVKRIFNMFEQDTRAHILNKIKKKQFRIRILLEFIFKYNLNMNFNTNKGLEVLNIPKIVYIKFVIELLHSCMYIVT